MVGSNIDRNGGEQQETIHMIHRAKVGSNIDRTPDIMSELVNYFKYHDLHPPHITAVHLPSTK